MTKPRLKGAPVQPTSLTPEEKRHEAIFGGAAVIVDDIAGEIPRAAAVKAKPASLAVLGKHGYSQEEIFALVVPKRTLARRTAKHELLSVEETDKAMRLARVATQAERVFGNPDKANRWLRKPKRQLGSKTPLAFLSSEAGAREVEAMLFRIEHGILA